MPSITTILLTNFKRFDSLELALSDDLNILLGDNEAGKSTVLLAIDLVLSASRSKVNALGVESLLPARTVRSFMAGKRAFIDLPKLLVEVYLKYSGNPDFNGRINSKGIECDGLRMECEVPDGVSKEVVELLKDSEAPFPYEYYATTFSTFASPPRCLRSSQRRDLATISKGRATQLETHYSQQALCRLLAATAEPLPCSGKHSQAL